MKKYILFFAIAFQACVTQELSEENLFQPTKEYALTKKYEFNHDFIEVDDSIRIESWMLRKKNAKVNIIYLSGNGSNVRSAIPLFNSIEENIAANIFTFNYRGYGQSSGIPSIEKLTYDASHILDVFQEEYNKNNLPNILIGYSLGGYIVLDQWDSEYIDAYATIATFSSSMELEKYIRKNTIPGLVKPFLKIKVDNELYKLDNLSNIEKLTKPVLLIHGSADKFIPPEMSLNLKDKANSEIKEYYIIDDADHKTILMDNSYTNIIAQNLNIFIGKHLSIKDNDSQVGPLP